MTRKELSDAVAEATGYTKKDTYEVTKAVFRVIADTLEGGESVAINSFGVFKVIERAPRTCTDPMHPDQKLTIPARRVGHFSPYPIFKDKLNGEDKAHRYLKYLNDDEE